MASYAQTARTATHLVPTGKGWAVAVPQDVVKDHPELAPDIVTTGNGILYHGGPVMHGSPVHVYFIWYGNWSNGLHLSDHADTVNLMHTLFAPTRGMGSSPYFRITTTYGDAKGNVTGNLAEVASVSNSYSHGKQLTDANVQEIVFSSISDGLPKDTNGIYFVLTSSDVAETSGFCTNYCGWHNHGYLEGADIKYAFVGNPDRCPSACEAQSLSPNGDSGADGMASIMAHETVESVTDPDLNAWYDAQGNEVGDKCAWKFGPYKSLAGHGVYNETFGTYNWLVQMEWENAHDGGCAQALGGKFYNQ
jgi:hypothetical protein